MDEVPLYTRGGLVFVTRGDMRVRVEMLLREERESARAAHYISL